MIPRSGDTLYVGNDASVQFGFRPINFRVSHIMPLTTYDGWMWLDGYELDAYGDAVEQRKIFVQPAGLRLVDNPVWLPRRRRPAIPRPRISPDALPAAPAKAVTA